MLDPLDFSSSGPLSVQFREFACRYLCFGGGEAMEPRDWQVDIVSQVFDPQPRPRLAAVAMPRGNGKSSLAAALAVWVLMTGRGASVDVVAVDERQAGLVFGMAAKFIARNPDLECRVTAYKDRLVVPGTESEMSCLPGTPAALEGRNPTLCIVDEGGRVATEAYEVVALASGKQKESTVLVIGTPGPRPDNVLAGFRDHARTHPDDTSQVYVEIGAAGFEDHPTDCQHCWELASPALDDFLFRDALAALQPPKMTESHFRRVRLVQWVTDNENPFVTADVWDVLGTGEDVPDGAEVVIGLDGSHSRDCTALVVATVSATPHVATYRLFRPEDSPDHRIDVLAVEQAIRDAYQRWNVTEVAADPHRWTRTLQVLAAEGIPIMEIPQSGRRLTAMTTALHSAIVNRRMTHSSDADLREHVLAASVVDTADGGLKLGKVSRSKDAPRIDLAAALVMAYSRATWLAGKQKKRFRVITR
ncbi:terminase large subunit domain-containing protein [[Mycobacterium] holstebronense]|uniref:Terminase large subunit n=1 Tax=[Mycobacterium] holstebronense TaxID=3064288 RepID=A0ABN9NCK7_9MYCO|nr:terminase large subunit [Mycolicibacter sp. MU0102]CAJ1504150.1 terminase large subunit [Mycolicibacter sp. MU0102]